MEVFDIVVQLVNAFTFLYLNYLFFGVFFKRKAKSYTTIVVFTLLTSILATVLLLWRGTIFQVMATVSTCLLLSCLFESKFIYKLVFGCISMAIQTVVECTVGISLQLIFNVGFDQTQNGATFVIGMLMSKLVAFILILLIWFTRKKEFSIYLDKRNLPILFLPIGSILTFFVFFRIWQEFDKFSAISNYMLLICGTIIFISNIIMIDYINNIYKNTVNESRMGAALELIDAQREQYQAMLEHNRDIMKIEHDNKNFCIGLITDLKEGRVEDAISKLTEAHDLSMEKQSFSGDTVSTIVSIKRKLAQENNIEIVYDRSYKGELFVQATDLAVILGNALDNAIEACCKIENPEDKTVKLIVSYKNDSIVMLIKNPVSDSVDVSNLITDKNDAKMHGFGIISMKQIADKYNGDVIFSCEDDVFTTRIILNNVKEA